MKHEGDYKDVKLDTGSLYKTLNTFSAASSLSPGELDQINKADYLKLALS